MKRGDEADDDVIAILGLPSNAFDRHFGAVERPPTRVATTLFVRRAVEVGTAMVIVACLMMLGGDPRRPWSAPLSPVEGREMAMTLRDAPSADFGGGLQAKLPIPPTVTTTVTPDGKVDPRGKTHQTRLATLSAIILRGAHRIRPEKPHTKSLATVQVSSAPLLRRAWLSERGGGESLKNAEQPFRQGVKPQGQTATSRLASEEDHANDVAKSNARSLRLERLEALDALRLLRQK